jgi:hypothetical protein
MKRDFKGKRFADVEDVKKKTREALKGITILAGFDVLTAVVTKSSISWDIMPCSPLKVSRCFGGTCLLATLHHSGFLLALFSLTLKMEVTCSSKT